MARNVLMKFGMSDCEIKWHNEEYYKFSQRNIGNHFQQVGFGNSYGTTFNPAGKYRKFYDEECCYLETRYIEGKFRHNYGHNYSYLNAYIPDNPIIKEFASLSQENNLSLYQPYDSIEYKTDESNECIMYNKIVKEHKDD